MLFSSVLFLFKFLPIVLIGNFFLRNFYRNLFILISSLFFYYWGEEGGVLIMLSSILINYLFGLLIGNSSNKFNKKTLIFIAVGLNLGLLIFYKYFYFLVNMMGLPFYVGTIALPLGISFFTFQGLSYVIDVYRNEVEYSKNPLDIALYISLFPQLIAGPIVRYKDINFQIKKRSLSYYQFNSGIKKFTRGLFKKVVIANNVGMIADLIMVKSDISNLPFGIAWVGIVAYTLQIYFDFSGYSDMAIGIGKMLGFNFKENFKHPYFSFSIREFWRRWHISLSTWFRDYLYIPLGGNRKGSNRTFVNLLIVFFLTGLWHGASWNFVLWGMLHGLFLILERYFGKKWKTPKFISYFYTILVVMIAWVFFKIEDFDNAVLFLKKLFLISSGGNDYYSVLFMSPFVIFIFILGLLFCLPLRRWIKNIFRNQHRLPAIQIMNVSLYLLILIFSIIELSMSNYNPFIYFRF